MLNETTLATIAARHGIGTTFKPKGRAEEAASVLFSVGEVVGAAFGMGWVNGRFQSEGKDHWEIPGLRVPADLTIGCVGVLTSLLDWYGPLNGHVASVAAGVAATWFARTGLTKGVEQRAKVVEKLAAQATSGMLGAPSQPAGQSNVVSFPHQQVPQRQVGTG